MQNYRYNPSQRHDYRQANMCCDKDDVFEGMPLAMAYVPWQMWRNICDAEKGFHHGTIFEELNKPFHGTGGWKR